MFRAGILHAGRLSLELIVRAGQRAQVAERVQRQFASEP